MEVSTPVARCALAGKVAVRESGGAVRFVVARGESQEK
jgi:hypothetical protein